MSSKSVSIVVVLLVIIGIGGGVYLRSQSASSTQSQTAAVGSVADNNGTVAGASESSSSVPTAKSFSAQQVATHKDAQSCWTIIDNSVYDLTPFVSQHPGGEDKILSICGIDGTAAFHGQHGDDQRQAKMLAEMKIGILSQ